MIYLRCGVAVETLYIEVSGSNLRLTRCDRCNCVADKYVEYELQLVLMDIVLHRRPAARHLMFNRFDREVKEVRTLMFDDL